MDGPDLFRPQAGCRAVLDEAPAAPMADSALGADPQIAAAIFEQRAGAEVGQSVGFAEAGEDTVAPPADAFVGADPHAAVAAFEDGADEVVHQPVPLSVLHAPAAGCTEYPFALGAEPECARTVVQHVAHAN